jgi:hypothetical protein
VCEAGKTPSSNLLQREALPVKRFPKRRFIRFCAAGLGIVFSACGSLDSNTNVAPTLATLQGSLVNPRSLTVSSSSAVRVAVVWRGAGPEQFNVAEDLPVQPVFPSSFTIALNGPPPAGAMNSDLVYPAPLPTQAGAGGPSPDGGGDEASTEPPPPVTPPVMPTNPDPGFQFAIGTVVAYLDENHNGKLDLVSDDASAYVDKILAANPEVAIVYLQGPIPDALPFVDSEASNRPKDGYNLFRQPECSAPKQVTNPVCPSAPAPDPGTCTQAQWLGIDTPYTLTVASNPEVATLMCLTSSSSGIASEATGTAGPFNPAIQPAKYPSPSDPNVCCASDGSDYLYATCKEISEGLCQGTIESCTLVGYVRPTPVPADWPCEK